MCNWYGLNMYMIYNRNIKSHMLKKIKSKIQAFEFLNINQTLLKIS